MDIVVSASTVGFNAQQGGSPLPAQVGQVVDALVLQVVGPNMVRLSIADTVMDVATQVPLAPGTMVRLAVKGTGAETRLVIVGTSALPDGDGSRKASVPTVQARYVPLVPEPAGRSGRGPADAAPDPAPRAAGAPPSPPDVRAVADAARLAAGRQTGLAPLFADAAAAQFAELPPPLAQALTRLMALRVPLADTVSAAMLREAAARSGLFLEADIATAGAGGTRVDAAGDLKAALLSLRQVLRNPAEGQSFAAAGIATPVSQPRPRAAPGSTLPPPYRGAPTAAQPAVPAAVTSGADAQDVRDILLADAEGALARQVLLQAASLPADAHGPADESTRWSFEIPFAVAAGAVIVQFEIVREGRRAASAGVAVWRANLSVEFAPLGPVHAHISLVSSRTSVRLLAERPATAAALRAQVRALAEGLRSAGLDAADIVVGEGAPAAAAQAAASGRFVDRAT